MKTRRRIGSWCCALLIAFASLPLGAETFWTTGGGRLAALALDFQTGAAAVAMQGIGHPAHTVEYSAATTDPVTGILWVLYFDHAQDRAALGRLPVGTALPQEVLLFPEGPPRPGFLAEFAPSGLIYFDLFDASSNSTTLATLDPATGLITPVIAFGPGDSLLGLSFHPLDGKLYIAGNDNCAAQCVAFIDTLTLPQHQRARIWESEGYGIGEPLFSSSGEMLIMALSFYRAEGNTLQWFSNPAAFQTPFGPQFFYALAGAPAEGTEGCVPSFSRACLQKRRFAVDVTYDASIFGGSSGPATPLMESDVSLKFSFFQPENLELLLKIIDGCSYNGHYWVFFSGLTNVGVSLRITDMLNGAVYTYDNPPGTTLVPALDIQALACGS